PDDLTADKSGLDKPRMTIVATAKDGASKSLVVGKDDGQSTWVKLADGPRVWKIHKYEVDRFPSSPVQWRDKAILKLDPATVTTVEIMKEKDKTVLERVDDKTFKVTTPAGFTDLDQPRVQGLVRQISTLRASRIVEGADPKAVGMDKP